MGNLNQWNLNQYKKTARNLDFIDSVNFLSEDQIKKMNDKKREFVLCNC
jgi:hypothetical protein